MIRILLPTDFSENACSAADYVCDTFNLEEVQLVLVHAVIPPRSSPGMMISLSDLMEKDAKEALAKEKERLVQKFNIGVEIKTATRLGYLVDLVPSFCTKFNIDLIAMGTQGENQLASKIFGSNTEQVVRKAKTPVLAIPDKFPVRKNLHICMATPEPELPNGQTISRLFSGLRHRELTHFIGLHVMTNDEDKAVKSLTMGGLQVPVEVIKANSPEEGIRSYLESKDVDVLVVNHAHKSRFDYLFGRSTTKKLAGYIQVPMMVVPN